MSFFTEPAFSSHIPSVHNPNAGMGEVAQQQDWPLWVRSSALQGYPTGITPPFAPTLSTPPVASVPTSFAGTSFYTNAGLQGDDSSDTANAAAAAGPAGGQVAPAPAPTNWLKIGGIVAGTFLIMHLVAKGR